MGFFSDLIASSASNALNSLFSSSQPSRVTSQASRPSGPLVEMCNQLGWTVQQFTGKSFILNFADPVVGTRTAYISGSDGGHVVAFSVLSAAVFAPRNMPAELPAYVLSRNKSGAFHSWTMLEHENGSMSFSVGYTALLAGLDATLFKTICDMLCIEVQSFDTKMRECGVI
jgi:hypothetical protein